MKTMDNYIAKSFITRQDRNVMTQPKEKEWSYEEVLETPFLKDYVIEAQGQLYKNEKRAWGINEPIELTFPSIFVELDTEIISIPNELTCIAKKIEDSKGILSLEDDWDSQGAVRISPKTFNNACNLLIDYSKKVLSTYKISINVPHINPCNNGSIDLVWKNEKARLLINVKSNNEKIIASGYGYLKNNAQPIQFILEKNKPTLEHLVFWMQNIS